MSQPSKKTPKTPPTELPDDEAILKLFPKKVVDHFNKAIGHTPKKTPKAKPTDKQ